MADEDGGDVVGSAVGKGEVDEVVDAFLGVAFAGKDGFDVLVFDFVGEAVGTEQDLLASLEFSRDGVGDDIGGFVDADGAGQEVGEGVVPGVFFG